MYPSRGVWSECRLLNQILHNLIFFLRFSLYILDQGEEREKGRERNINVCGCLSRAPYWGPDLARNPGMCPDWELNRLPFGLQAGTQSTEPHQPGIYSLILIVIYPICTGYLKILNFFCIWSRCNCYRKFPFMGIVYPGFHCKKAARTVPA